MKHNSILFYYNNIMKIQLFFFLLLSIYCLDDLKIKTELFEDYIIKFNKIYKDVEEKNKRFKIFCESLDEINRINNNEKSTWKAELTKLSDRSYEELSNPIKIPSKNIRSDFKNKNYPESVDFSEDGVVSDAIDQGDCHADYAIATIKNIESTLAIIYGELIKYSSQQVVDCSTYTYGCKNGSVHDSFMYISQNGLCLYDDYPYNGKENQCNYTQCKPATRVYEFNHISEFTESALLYYASQRPLVVSINAETIKNYKSGVISDECKGTPDVAMFLVGYGKENDVNYWKLQAPYGTNWGENGFIRVLKDKGGSGWCKIASTIYYALI